MVVVEGGEEVKNCCISHEFFKVASSNPNKIAVVHALGGARICTELRQKLIDDPGFDDEDRFFDFHSSCSSSEPDTYKGDEFFTFSEILDSVNTLCYRIRCVLDGVGDDDPSTTIRPTGNLHEKEAEYDTTSESSNAAGITGKQHDELPEMDTAPRVVGIYMVPSVEYIVSVLSILMCGEAFLPLDPSWPEERILYILSSAKVNLIITCSSSIHTSDNRQADWLTDRSSCSVLYMSMKSNLKDPSDPSDLVWPCESRKKRTFCYLMYTSGSTGKPKGVCGTGKGLLNRYLWMQELFPMRGKEILLFKTSLSFIDHLQEFLTAILSGTSLVVPPFEVLKANPLCIIDFLKAYSISRLTVVPSVIRAILLATRNHFSMRIQRSLHVLVLSGEVLSISLWSMLCKLLPETTILNLYGSTEVSGDCTYFDCKRLPKILETETLSSVPIGLPMSNCDIVLVGEQNESNEAEICVSGLCTSMGYFMDPDTTSLDYVKLPQGSGLCKGSPFPNAGSQVYFRTGDFARQLDSGDLVFLGRKDRTIKVNGQRFALEEVESVLREHPAVIDAAVISQKGQGISTYISAYVVPKSQVEFCETLICSIKSFLRGKLPPAMIPNRYLCVDSLPMSFTGKVDYASLTGSTFVVKQFENQTDITHCDLAYLQVIKKAFCEALMVDEVVDDIDFFEMGGNSISAAQVAYKLGINMKLLYTFPSPSKLLNALEDGEPSYKGEFTDDSASKVRLKKQKINMINSLDLTTPLCNKKLVGSPMRVSSGKKHDSPITYKSLTVDSDLLSSNGITSRAPWIPNFFKSRTCSFSRCNKVVAAQDGVHDLAEACWSIQTPARKGSMYELWKVHLRSCVDASPLIVSKNGGIYLFIGSHSHLFLCIDALSGFPQWEVKLEGRIECSAAIIDDFSQVVVGCYKGKIYFLDFVTGSIRWAFQTGGEVKSQPVVDVPRKLVWCGSYDHNLYALDYKNHCCVYQVSCSGSLYGSPCINAVYTMLYVASTKGSVTALSLETSPFNVEWIYELGRPVFGSLSTSPQGNVVCCLVDGHVIVLSPGGSIIWKAITGGPIFAGACISPALPSQVLICSRNGSVYSFESETGDLVWEYNVGDPITSSAYIDEDLELISDPSHPPDRLVCICSSSGRIYLLRIHLDTIEERDQLAKNSPKPVQEFAKMDLAGDIFSSPVMIGTRLFVGCRDDYVHCIGVEVFDEKRVES